jgi:hypothetical protein
VEADNGLVGSRRALRPVGIAPPRLRRPAARYEPSQRGQNGLVSHLPLGKASVSVHRHGDAVCGPSKIRLAKLG